jgi:heme-degrading monooxygenase HmoA
MIARIWHGATPAAQADAYLELLFETGMRDYRATPGNRGAYVLRRLEGERAHFLTLTFWDSWEAVKAFAGDAPEKARYYSEDERFLLEFEPTVQHYEVFTDEPASSP